MSFWCHRLDQNSNENIVRISGLEFFEASWGLPGDLVSNIINKEVYRKPQKASWKLQGSFKKFQGRNLYNIFVAILVETMTPKRHFKINWPLNDELLIIWFTGRTASVHKHSGNAFKHCYWKKNQTSIWKWCKSLAKRKDDK